MVSMKTEAEMPQPYQSDCCPIIYLSDDQVEALGITSPPPAGSVFMISARAVATRVTQAVEEAGEGEGAAPDICMTLQITDMEIQPSSGKSIAETLYGG